MFRLILNFPNSNDTYKVESKTWSACSLDRVALAAIYTAALASGSTITLYGLDITTELLTVLGLGWLHWLLR
jgi:hypothetical protein